MFNMQISTQTGNYNLSNNVATNKKFIRKKMGLKVQNPSSTFYEKGLLFPGKMLVCGWNVHYLEFKGVY